MNENRLWYKKPANSWNEALPIGNGRIGAMIYGNILKEQIQLNEDSVWSGGFRDRNNPDALENLPAIRQLIFDGKIAEAEDLMLCALSGTPHCERVYQTLGDLFLNFKDMSGDVTEYIRELDISSAIHTVSYKVNGYLYRREMFSTAVDNCIVINMTTDNPEGISVTPMLKRGKFYDYARKIADDSVIIGGALGKDVLEYAAMLKVRSEGGTQRVIGERIVIEHAKSVTIYLDGITTYRCKSVEEYLINSITNVSASSYETIKNNHIRNYQELYKRVNLKLTDEFSDKPTDERKSEFEKDDSDQGLLELYFNYGRYLLISCSRPGSLPANLQGLWNDSMQPSWDSKYTININTEMNYWPAEMCNLSECHMPLFDLIDKMLPNGRVTAKKMYGCRGFVAHHNTDLWGDTAVQDLWVPGSYWAMGAAWLCTHMWIHYEYTKDIEFLKKSYPIMKEAALFFLDFLVEHNGYLVTCPSVSPENTFILPNGVYGANTSGVSMDNQIIRDLFTQCISADEILGLHDDITDELRQALCRIRPDSIGKYGQLMEWEEDYEEKDKGHRHISHLYGLHPSNQITVDGTPELAEAAAVTLERRLSNGGGHTGWSRAWIINDYAKLWNGEEAYANLAALINKSTLPNLFDNHPPFQIDGNFGGITGIAEMLVQSTYERIILLPALPAKWRNGKVSGLCVRGGAELEFEWNNHALEYCRITAKCDIDTIVKYKDKSYNIKLMKGQSKVL